MTTEASLPAAARAAAASTEPVSTEAVRTEAVSTEELTLEGPHGPLRVRIYRPVEATGPGIVWLHGGGFSGGDLDMPEGDWVSRSFAERGILAVSLDYRLAPTPPERAAALDRPVVREGVHDADNRTGNDILRRLSKLIAGHLAKVRESRIAALPEIEAPKL